MFARLDFLGFFGQLFQSLLIETIDVFILFNGQISTSELVVDVNGILIPAKH